ncbi:MAG: hypothetical protein OXF23_00410 [Candidatus Dadabacteria bacterium]|nr:hypothetical protein [Candidatus Dadabacteria bacterium]
MMAFEPPDCSALRAGSWLDHYPISHGIPKDNVGGSFCGVH